MLTDKYNSLCGIELHGLYTRVNITSMEYEASEVLTGGISRQLPCNRLTGNLKTQKTHGRFVTSSESRGAPTQQIR